MERSAELFGDIAEVFPEQASYAVAMAYRVRYVMQFNAREAMHLIELRSGVAGPPGVPAGRPGDASADRRAGRPHGDRRGDDPPDDGRRRSSSGSSPSGAPSPDAVTSRRHRRTVTQVTEPRSGPARGRRLCSAAMAAPDDDDAKNEDVVEDDFEPEEDDDESEEAEPDPDELDVEDLEEAIPDDDDDDAEVADDEEEEDDEDDTAATTRTKRRAGEEEEDEDDDLLSPDDVEADLDRILKDRMVTDRGGRRRGGRGGRARRAWRHRRSAAAEASRRAAVPELLPAGPGVGAGLPGGRRRLSDLHLMTEPADPFATTSRRPLHRLVGSASAGPCGVVRAAGRTIGESLGLARTMLNLTVDGLLGWDVDAGVAPLVTGVVSSTSTTKPTTSSTANVAEEPDRAVNPRHVPPGQRLLNWRSPGMRTWRPATSSPGSTS